MFIFLASLIALSSIPINGLIPEVFPIHDDGQDLNNHFLKGRTADAAHRISSRIANGADAKPGEFPFLVQLRYNDNYLCAGALIYGFRLNQVVLTTAECVSQPNGNYYDLDKISIIGRKYHKDSKYFYEQTVQPSKIIRHEKWDRYNIINDLAVVFLRKQFEINSLVHTIELPHKTRNGFPHPDWLTVGGWGFFQDDKYAPILQVLRVPTLSYQECWNWYVHYDNARHLNKQSTLCARNDASSNRNNLCKRDWGAPARAYDNGTEYLAGIFSWAEQPCGNNRFPTLFQKITHFRQWILDTSVYDPYLGKK